MAKAAVRKCEQCGGPNKSKRADSKFCSPKCRTAAARAAGADPETGEVLAGPGPVAVKPLEKAYDREKNLAAFIGMGMEDVDFISTGIAELDDFQQIPRGRITQIQGPYAVGKTTLALNMIRGLSDKKVFYIDSEASLNPYLLVDLGLSAKNFVFWNKTAYIEDIYDQVIEAAKSGKYDIIILDSLAACTSKTEAEGESSARNIGHKALIVNKLMRIVPMQLKDTNTALVIINQEREMIGTYVPTKYTPGGMGPLYSASLILGLKTIPSWRFPKDAKNGEYRGHEIEVKVLKSKVSRPHRVTKVKLFYVDPAGEKSVAATPTVKEEF
jgi:recombination protein RecA